MSAAGVAEAYFAAASAPWERPRLELLVKRDASLGQALPRLVRDGEALWLRGPFADAFSAEALQARPLVLVATGTGIAPLRSAVRGLDAPREGVHLLYGVRRPEDAAYASEWAGWQRDGVRLTVVFSRAQHAPPAARTGYVYEPVGEVIAELGGAAAGARVLYCGQPTLGAALRRAVQPYGIPATRVVTNFE